MRTSTILTAIILATAVTAPLAAMAQQARQPERATAPPPPQMERLEEGEAPAVNIPGGGRSEKSITEKREQGRVTEVEVKSGRSTYVVRPLNVPGSAVPGDTESPKNRAAQFRVKEFDLNRPEDLKPLPERAAEVPPAPGAASATGK